MAGIVLLPWGSWVRSWERGADTHKFLYIYGMSPFEALALLQAAPAFRHPVIQPPAVDSSTNPARWADLGCGSGLFTLALASLLPAASTVYAIDRYPAIRSQLTPNQVSIQPKKADFVKQNLPTLRPRRRTHGQLPPLCKR